MKLTKGMLDSKYNLPELDDVPCKICGKIPPTKKIKRTSSKGRKNAYIDRSSRIDCDVAIGDKPSKNVVYCIKCWRQEVFGKKHETRSAIKTMVDRSVRG